jgi:hypothetical protein
MGWLDGRPVGRRSIEGSTLHAACRAPDQGTAVKVSYAGDEVVGMGLRGC